MDLTIILSYTGPEEPMSINKVIGVLKWIFYIAFFIVIVRLLKSHKDLNK